MKKHIPNNPPSRQLNSTNTPMQNLSKHKPLSILFTLFAVLLAAAHWFPPRSPLKEACGDHRAFSREPVLQGPG